MNGSSCFDIVVVKIEGLLLFRALGGLSLSISSSSVEGQLHLMA